ncbi:MAG: sodium:proton antiporter [Oscillospiraceae bacterium]|nr:sodium:proton antiporter [Oscillospiraceae bacterium]
MTVYFVLFFPVAAALLVPAFRTERLQGRWATAVCLITLVSTVVTGASLYGSQVVMPALRLRLAFDGFRVLYAVIVCFMWTMAALLSPEYFEGHRHMKRYYCFFLLCLGATVGVFLAADLYTLFLFFEIMSLGSYVWVVQEETEGAMAAGRTYLTIAVLGGLVTLMGLFLLYHLTGTLEISALKAACLLVANRRALWAAALCIFFGFAAKAGAFPLHIWLPKAHPVAPAPASALLSGVLTKAGVLGVLIITARILPYDDRWGTLLLAVGTVTMVLGAVMAVCSTNIKHIFACSSLSQIGFILVGVSMINLLGEENALAAHGTVLYMMNHSLVKLTLFLLSGVVYMNCHALDLNDIRGFGRNKPWLHLLFLLGAGSLAGIPGLCGYLSKTLVHEAIVAYAHLSQHWAITAVEWLFLISGGLTAAYLTKVYVALFWQKGKEIDPTWGTWRSWLAVTLSAVTLPVLGLAPHALEEKLTGLTLGFTGGHPLPHQVHYFSPENLKGVAISLAIGMAVYFLFIRRVLMDREGNYVNRWPRWLDMEEYFYKPILHTLTGLAGVAARAVCDLPDAVILLLRRTVLRPVRSKARRHPYTLGARMLARFRDLAHPDAADRFSTVQEAASRMAGSLSFALLATCLGVCALLVAVMIHVFG